MNRNLKTISQTVHFQSADYAEDSDEENEQKSHNFHSIAHKLPKPNPLFLEDTKPVINSLLDFKQNNTNLTDQTQIKCSAKQNEQIITPQQTKEVSLLEHISKYTIVYQKYKPQDSSQYYSTLFYNGSYMDKSYYYQLDDIILFDSLFESGNLFQAYLTYHTNEYYEYDLILQNDVNSKGYNQWFYFSVISKQSQIKIKLNIININKDMKLYHEGNRIFIYENDSWKKSNLDLQFYKNSIYRSETQYYHTLSFSYTFTKPGQVYFAANYPYTYSNLQSYFQKQSQRYQSIMTVRTFSLTDAQNQCQIVTITNPKSINQKSGVLFLARQHPGETASSFIAEGIMDFLLSSEAITLRDNYIFKIIPMLNVDGVIHGNQRCSLKGYDLNRKWSSSDDSLINNTKRIIQQFHQSTPIKLLIDLHAHSRKMNAFFYGQRMNKYIQTVCSQDMRFKLDKCRFMNPTNQIEKTARVALQKLLNIQQVYTLETSYYGYEIGDYKQDFTMKDLRELGRTLCKNINELQQDETIDVIQEVDQLSQSDSEATEDEIKENDLKKIKNKPVSLQNQTINIRSPQVSTRKQMSHKRSASKPQRQIVKQISHSQQLSYNFVSNEPLPQKAKNNTTFQEIVFQTLSKPKTSQLDNTFMLPPQHSLKHQFMIQSKQRKAKELPKRLPAFSTEQVRRSNTKNRKPLLVLNL